MWKMLIGLNQKVCGQVQGLQRSPAADVAPPAQRHDLTHSGIDTEHGKPVVLPRLSNGGKRAARRADGAAGKGRGRKRRPPCNGADRGCDITPPERGQTSLGCRRAWTVSQPAQAVLQICRRGRNDLCWCYSHHRNHLGSRPCRSNAQAGPKANGEAACLPKARCPMLEPYASKGACTVLRGGGAGNSSSLPDQM
jgi:hypothetical protein